MCVCVYIYMTSMAQQVKALASKYDDLSSRPRTHMVKKKANPDLPLVWNGHVIHKKNF